MEFAQFYELISGVITPIGVCAFLLWERKTTQEKTNEILDTLSKNILENTIILKQIFDKISKGE